jgi:hypothetical protein
MGPTGMDGRRFTQNCGQRRDGWMGYYSLMPHGRLKTIHGWSFRFTGIIRSIYYRMIRAFISKAGGKLILVYKAVNCVFMSCHALQH